MKPIIILFSLLFSVTALGQSAVSPDSLLDRMTGNWILRGTIGGTETIHDVTVDWVLAHEYLQMHEVSRERDSVGRPAYEAIVFVGWNQRLGEYGCLWLDNTGVWDFSDHGIGKAKPNGYEIPFLFKGSGTDRFHTTFVYDRKNDSWKWMMDDEQHGKSEPFARVTLTRRK